MKRAKKVVLSRGGAARCNVFTRITLALYGQLPWRGVPLVPVEIMLLPRWFPFHLSKVSYWSRTVMVPLAVLCSLKARANNPRQVNIRELFVRLPENEDNYFPVRSFLNRVFILLDTIAHILEPMIPSAVRRIAMKRAGCDLSCHGECLRGSRSSWLLASASLLCQCSEGFTPTSCS